MTKFFRSHTGFTLIEAVVAVGVFAVLSTMTSVMMFGALRGAKRAAAVAGVRNEGAYALGTMSQMLRYAEGSVDCPYPNAVGFTSIADKRRTIFSCTTEDQSIASGSANLNIKLLSPKVQTQGCSITCSPTNDQVYIVFTLVPVGSAQSVVDAATITFDSQVQIRNAR